MMDKDWYTNFFSGVVVDLWRDAVPPEQTRLEVDSLQRWLQLESGQHVLDVPCGCGRHALELAQRGMRLSAVDVSPEMVEQGKLRQQMAEAESDRPQAIDWRVAEMRQLDWTDAFDAAFCFGNSFGYLDHQGMSQFLGSLARALKPKARFAFDYGMSAESILPRFTEFEWSPMGDILFLEQNQYDVQASCIETTYKFVRDGKTETRIGLHFVYTVAEIQRLLTEVGFEVLSLLAGYEDQPFGLGSPVLCVVAERE